jgi:hypothetical protein
MKVSHDGYGIPPYGIWKRLMETSISDFATIFAQ